MVRPSKLMRKLENRVRFGKLFERHRKKIKYLIPLGLCAWYFYGMVLNSIRLGIDSTFDEAPVETIWIVNPLLNLLAVFTPTGLAVTAVGVLLFCLITQAVRLTRQKRTWRYLLRYHRVLKKGLT